MNHRSTSNNSVACLRPVRVTSSEQLAELLPVLAAQTSIAVDTESNSLYAYRERVCLIQFSTIDTDFLVDPLTGFDLAPLGDIFASSKIMKVFHAAEYDVMCLKRDFGFEFANLFDTMWAGRILGWPRVGLGDILREEFGVRTNKRYQRYNWGKRPLESDALAYACLDTHYLLPLQRSQTEALKENGRWEEAQEVFAQVAASQAASSCFDPQGFWRIKGVSNLTRRELAILSALYVWRDQEAQRRDRPPFKVLNDHTLVELAQARPRTLDQLARTALLKPHSLRRYGKGVLQAIRRGSEAKLPTPPPPAPRRPREEVVRFEALRAWRRKMAADRGVDPDVVLSNAVLWELAELNPHTPEEWSRVEGVGPWRRRTYGKEILEVLRSTDRIGT